jgi:hypothetical protein
MGKAGLLSNGSTSASRRPAWCRNLIVVDGSRPARTSLVEEAIAAILQEAAAPFANCMFVQARFSRDRLAGQSARTSQNDAAPLGQRSGDAMAAHLPLQIAPLLGAQFQRRSRPAL